MGGNVELQETLNDIESMSYLGRYYADKMRGAAKLAVFRQDRQRKQFNAEAVAHFKDAVTEWKAYAGICSSQYKTQVLARTAFLDWSGILAEVGKEALSAEREGDYPDVRFTNLRDGAHLAAQSELRVEVAATDRDGIREVKLYLNGLLMKAHAKQPRVWSGSSDELLKALKPGIYQLVAVVVDNTGVSSRQQIQITVGDVSESKVADWRDEIHQVVLNEGDRLTRGDVRDFPRLECKLSLDEYGILVLRRSGAAVASEDEDEEGRGRRGSPIWRTAMHKDWYGPNFATLEKGQLVIYRGTPGHPELALWKSKATPGPGTYRLGITASKRLVVFREVEGNKREIVWKGN
jgi:hypothetical protein